jgi:formiminotetrahydrofolate cyclodeaminase
LASPEVRARQRLGYLLGKIASREPAPASGSAAATVVAASAALLQKVALRSETWEGAAAAYQRAEELRLQAEALIELDSTSFLEYVAAQRTGADVEPAREKTIDAPLAIARAGAEVVALARALEKHGNPNLMADSVAAAMLGRAAVATAAMLVEVNLMDRRADSRLAEARRLVREVSASARRPAARGRSDDRGRASARSRGSDRPSAGRSSRAARSSASSGRGRGSSRKR